MRTPQSAPEPSVGTAVEPSPQPVIPAFDWDAARLRDNAMPAIRALAAMPAAQEVANAWEKSNSYGEPLDTLLAAQVWLSEFIKLYRVVEPRRWARVLASRSREVADVAD